MYPWPREMIEHLQVTQILVGVTLGPVIVHIGGRLDPEKSPNFTVVASYLVSPLFLCQSPHHCPAHPTEAHCRHGGHGQAQLQTGISVCARKGSGKH